MSISRLQPVPLRELWKHEAHNFTHWLCENLDLLSETIGFKVTLEKREKDVGPFYADILAEDERGNFVVIENQLEKTDHDHLGKLITYLSNLNAKTAIWITSEPCPEHEKAIHWLNEFTPADTVFFLLELHAYKINDSDPAPLLSVIAGPNPESKVIGQQKKDLAERHVLRFKFWEALLGQAKQSLPQFAGRNSTNDNWIYGNTGTSGIVYEFIIRMTDAQVGLYIDVGNGERNKKIFDILYLHKDKIEGAFGGPLDWQRLEQQRGSRICHILEGSGLKDQKKWPNLQKHMIESMEALINSIQPEIDQLKLQKF